MNYNVFWLGGLVGGLAFAAVGELGWPVWVPPVALGGTAGLVWLARDYFDARRCREQWRQEREGAISE